MQLILASSSQGRYQLLSLFQIPFKVIPSTIDEYKIIAPTPLTTIKLRARAKGENVISQLTTHNTSTSLSASPQPTTTYLILSADSGAIIDGKLIGKPKNEKEAMEILKGFSGKTHEFVTAIYAMRTSSKFKTQMSNRNLKTKIPNFCGEPRLLSMPTGNTNWEVRKKILTTSAKIETEPTMIIEKTWQTHDRSLVTMRKLSDDDIKLHLKLSNYTKYAGGYALFDSPVDLISKVEGSLTNVVGLPLNKLIPILRENNLV